MYFKDSYADAISGESYVTIMNKGKTYGGKARCNPEDEWSEFTGCRFAHLRAIISALKDELREAKADYKSCKDFVTAVSQYKKFNSDDPSAKAMYRQLNRKQNKVILLGSKIEFLEYELKTEISAKDFYKEKTKEVNDND